MLFLPSVGIITGKTFRGDCQAFVNKKTIWNRQDSNKFLNIEIRGRMLSIRKKIIKEYL